MQKKILMFNDILSCTLPLIFIDDILIAIYYAKFKKVNSAEKTK